MDFRIIRFILRCLEVDPKKRYSWNQVYADGLIRLKEREEAVNDSILESRRYREMAEDTEREFKSDLNLDFGLEI